MINLDTGKQEFVLKFDGEHIEKIYFNPTDPALMVRIRNFCKESGKNMKMLDDIEFDEKGRPVSESFADVFGEMLDIIYSGLDKAFAGDISKTVFKYCSPFAKVGDGEFFFAAFVEAITPEIKKRIADSETKNDENIEKHIGKYRK